MHVIGDGSSFTMSGSATVSGNTASNGGGVFVLGSFTKTGGVIYGSNETNPVLRNTVTGTTNKGAAVYVDSTHRCETTVGADAGQDLYASSYDNNAWFYQGHWTD
jgi:hypothetical protein